MASCKLCWRIKIHRICILPCLLALDYTSFRQFLGMHTVAELPVSVTQRLGSGNLGDVHLGTAYWLANSHGVENVALHCNALPTHMRAIILY